MKQNCNKQKLLESKKLTSVNPLYALTVIAAIMCMFSHSKPGVRGGLKFRENP